MDPRKIRFLPELLCKFVKIEDTRQTIQDSYQFINNLSFHLEGKWKFYCLSAFNEETPPSTVGYFLCRTRNSETQSQAKLDLTSTGGFIRAPHFGGGLPEGTRI